MSNPNPHSSHGRLEGNVYCNRCLIGWFNPKIEEPCRSVLCEMCNKGKHRFCAGYSCKCNCKVAKKAAEEILAVATPHGYKGLVRSLWKLVSGR